MSDLLSSLSSVLPSAEAPLKIAVLGSGFGSNFRSLVEKIEAGSLPAQIVCVGCDVAGAGILEFAREKGFPTIAIEPGKYKATLEPQVESQLVSSLREYGTELVVLAGFMRILKHDLLASYAGRIINIHPSLLPKYKGMHAWKQALESGDTVTGCTVHYVDGGVDTGATIAQAEVDVQKDDTAESLHARIQKAEHLLLPMVVEEIAKRRDEFLPPVRN
ncbi:MAG TPA: phosphoribosylglycinamide formyltransferase [Chthoniobacterales bacterium]|jgi:phosphoribosylglycinamide formyltransferase-1